MSRIGKNPVEIPDGVTVDISGQIVTAKGKLGELSVTLSDEVEVVIEDKLVRVKPRTDELSARKLWGTTRSILSNLVSGISEGFTRNLEIIGVGYRAQLQGKELILQLGFSHEIRFPVPDGIDIKCPDQTHVSISGCDKQLVGQTASEIRGFRPPEPYKGKGIRYEGEYVFRKEGKKK
ncbi:MAG: 50S ribosomal protein L6 [Rhodospirillales bacterium]|nr:50S ribosomal protein L6 [Rhodospirillales bacterium]